MTFLQGNIIDEKYAGSFAQLNGRPIVLLIIFSIIAHYVFITWKKVPISSYGLSYKTALFYKPDYAEAYSNLGIILKDLGKLTEAELFIKKATELNPNSVVAYSNLGNIF